jgi:hypothetical protein
MTDKLRDALDAYLDAERAYHLEDLRSESVSALREARVMAIKAAGTLRTALAQPAAEPPEDAAHGRCAAWLRAFTSKHGRDPFPQEVWDAAQPAASGEAPSVETLLAQARELARVTAERPGQAVAVPELLSTEGRKFMRGEPSLFDRAPLGDLQEVGGAMSACPHDVPHRWPCAECDAAPTEPVAWAIFLPDGAARMWSKLQPHVQKLADAEGLTVTPLYAHPPVAPEPTEQTPLRYALDSLYAMGLDDGARPADDEETNAQHRAAAVNLTLGRIAKAQAQAPVAALTDARISVLEEALRLVREYPDFDEGGPLAEMMDQVLAGQPSPLLAKIDELAALRAPQPKEP